MSGFLLIPADKRRAQMIAFVPFSQSGHKTHTHTQMYKNQKLILLVKLLSSTKPQTGLVQ